MNTTILCLMKSIQLYIHNGQEYQWKKTNKGMSGYIVLLGGLMPLGSDVAISGCT